LIATISTWIGFAEKHAAALAGLSLATLIMTFILLPIMIMRLPADYFVEARRPRPLSRHLVLHLLLMALKNLIGLALVILGLVLLFLPGQGLLMSVVGLTVMNYPGKFRLERWLVLRPNVLPTLIVLFSLRIPGIILAESTLSFLGYGIPPPTPTPVDACRHSVRRRHLEPPRRRSPATRPGGAGTRRRPTPGAWR